MRLLTGTALCLFMAMQGAVAQVPGIPMQGSDMVSNGRAIINNAFLFLGNGKVARWTGVGAPGSIPLSVQGDLYYDTSGLHTYACYSTVCSTAPNWARIDGLVTAPGSNGQLVYNLSTAFAAFTPGGDVTFTAPNFTVTGTGGVAFAPSATTNALNASNISSGTLPAARLPATVFQTNQSNTVTTGTQDFSASLHFIPKTAANVGALPATGCAAGEIAMVLSATLGQQIYENSGTGACVWTQQGGGGGGGASWASQLNDWLITRTSATVLTICQGASSTTPCAFRIGTRVWTFTAASTVTLTTGTGLAYIAGDASGVIGVYVNTANFTSVACSGCTVFNATQAPTDGVVFASWNATANTWDSTGTDLRAVFSNRGKFVASATITPVITSDSISFNALGGGPTPSGFYLTSGGTSYCGPTFQVCTPASGLTILTTAGSSTVNASGGTQVIQAKAAAGDNIIAVGQAIAGGNTSLTVAVNCSAFPSANSVYPQCGVGFRESATGKLVFIAQPFYNHLQGGSSGLTLYSFTNQTTFASTLSSNTFTYIGMGTIWWAKLTCSVAGCATGNITIQTSPDGVNWSQGFTEAVGGHFTTAPNQWYAYGSSSSTDNDLYVDIMSFLVQ
ncbi:MAG TPA: hypothetical protein VKQ11_00370 [Candidatus Sulfotelmatobacter sp.]|nr:hypothetical protein [Candidatus Sulfotelmatobacter sp.]